MSSLWVHQAAWRYACARKLGLRPGVVKPFHAFWVRGVGKAVCGIFDISLATDLLQTPARHQTTLHGLLYAPSKPLGAVLAVGGEQRVVLASLPS